MPVLGTFSLKAFPVQEISWIETGKNLSLWLHSQLKESCCSWMRFYFLSILGIFFQKAHDIDEPDDL